MSRTPDPRIPFSKTQVRSRLRRRAAVHTHCRAARKSTCSGFIFKCIYTLYDVVEFFTSRLADADFAVVQRPPRIKVAGCKSRFAVGEFCANIFDAELQQGFAGPIPSWRARAK